jgi:hypothetical protein
MNFHTKASYEQNGVKAHFLFEMTASKKLQLIIYHDEPCIDHVTIFPILASFINWRKYFKVEDLLSTYHTLDVEKFCKFIDNFVYEFEDSYHEGELIQIMPTKPDIVIPNTDGKWHRCWYKKEKYGKIIPISGMDPTPVVVYKEVI